MAGRAVNGDGSLYQRSDGLWVGAVVLGYDEHGRMRRKTVTSKKRNEALRKLRALQRTVESGAPPPDDQMTVETFLESWLDNVVPLRVSPSTAAGYRSLFKNHIKPVLGRKRLNSLKPDEVQRFVSKKLNEGLSPRTVRLLRGILVQALAHATRQGLLSRNVAELTDGPRQEAVRESRSLTVEEAKRLLEEAEGERLEALYFLMLSTGMRTGEAFALTWDNVDLGAGTVTITQALRRQPGGNIVGPGKTGKKGWRTNYIPPAVVAVLRDHKNRQEKERIEADDLWVEHNLVFCNPIGKHLDPDNHRREFSKLTQRAGLGHWHPHELRHSAATIMLAQGVPIEVVSKVAGHSSIRITADVYGHIQPEQQQRASAAMETALWS